MITLIKKISEKIIPIKYQLGLRFFYQKKINKLDAEMLYVSKLLINKRRFLDIGANIGIYSYHFKNSFKNVDAFEPLSEITYRLKPFQNANFKIHNVALSNKIGEFKFNIPIANGKYNASLASLEERGGECEVRTVKVETVDNYDFNDVDLIKIDVEGHEQFVIGGAINVIKNNKPILIVEIEQRHIHVDINEVFDTILNLNYSGFFIQNGQLIPLSNFSYEKNQKPFLGNVKCGEYINNFIFTPNQIAKD